MRRSPDATTHRLLLETDGRAPVPAYVPTGTQERLTAINAGVAISTTVLKAKVIAASLVAPGEVQGNLFTASAQNPKREKLMRTLDAINRTQLPDAIKYGALGLRQAKLEDALRLFFAAVYDALG